MNDRSSLDDLERAVEELINTADLSARQHEVYAARARELVRRLRAGIAECERVIEPVRDVKHLAEPAHVAFHVASDILAELTGATGEERSR